VSKINSALEWENEHEDPLLLIEVLREKNIVDEKSTREFFIFCNYQIFDLLDLDEKNVVLRAKECIDGKYDIRSLNAFTQQIFIRKQYLAFKTDPESKFLFGKLSISMICGYCPPLLPTIRFRRMIRISRGVQLLRMSSYTYAPKEYKKTASSNEEIRQILKNMARAQVSELKRLYKNPFR
jgi:hypothetical protein